jgi:hypothetical protein
MTEQKLAALAVERRTVAIAFFRNSHIEDLLIRHLPADLPRALISLSVVLNQVFERNSIEYFAFARLPEIASERQKQLSVLCIEQARAVGVPFVEVSEADIFAAYGFPALQRREQVRMVGKTIWPSLDSKAATRSAVDAALLGLYAQIERLFGFYEVSE